MKKGFTLAEVLITLAIIGVVAALTIPTLVTNYQKDQYVTQLKKAYSTVNNGFRAYMAQNGVTELSQTPLGTAANAKDSSAFMNEMGKVFKVLKSYQGTNIPDNDLIKYKGLKDNGSPYKLVSSNEFYTFFLADGAVLYPYVVVDDTLSIPHTTSQSHIDLIKSYNGKLYAFFSEFYIDINGSKGPNQYGRDLFYFLLSDQGLLFPFGSRDFSLYSYGDPDVGHWKAKDMWSCDEEKENERGNACAARIIEEGWKMTY